MVLVCLPCNSWRLCAPKYSLTELREASSRILRKALKSLPAFSRQRGYNGEQRASARPGALSSFSRAWESRFQGTRWERVRQFAGTEVESIPALGKVAPAPMRRATFTRLASFSRSRIKELQGRKKGGLFGVARGDAFRGKRSFSCARLLAPQAPERRRVKRKSPSSHSLSPRGKYL